MIVLIYYIPPQMLARAANYVYYEGDCFSQFKSPFIPMDAEEPSLAAVQQKSLRGPGLQERMDLVSRVHREYKKRIVSTVGSVNNKFVSNTRLKVPDTNG